MSFPFDAAFNLGSKLIEIVGRFIPDKSKAQELSAEIQRAVAQAMQAEMSSQWLVGQWRAMAMLCLTLGIVGRYVAGVLDFAGNDTDLALGLIWLIGFTGYSINGDTVKNLLAVIKPKKEETKK